MSQKTTECEVWVAVNAMGECQASDDVESIGDDLCGPYRLIKLVLTIPVPDPLILTATIPDQAGEVTLTVKQ